MVSPFFERSFACNVELIIHTGRVSDDEERAELQRRWQNRRDHAHYSVYPEGYEFLHNVGQGRHVVILLSPPNVIAVNRPDGSWFRTYRQPAHGPPPYSQRWYETYLRTHDLPSWWMSLEHIAMIYHDNESNFLQMAAGPSTDRVVPLPGYLELRYPETPQYLRPKFDSVGRNYAYNLSADEQIRLARRFPATTANTMSSNPDFRIVVTNDGYVLVRDREPSPDALRVPYGASDWIDDFEMLELADGKYRASYYIELDEEGDMPVTQIAAPPNRQALIDAIVEREREFVNLPQIPNGQGTWRWLQPDVDQRLAEALGLHDEFEVTQARQAGQLRVGAGPNAAPTVVYTPNRRHFNPLVQPAGNGEWQYLTDQGDGSTQALAWLNFGGQDYFPTNNQPTAGDMWNLRQAFRARIAAGEAVEDITADIHLVWVPEDEEEEAGTRASSLSPVPTDVNDSSGDEGTPVDPDKDPNTGLTHDPLNGGRNNQTGEEGQTFYQSRIILGQQQTIDRSRAHAGNREPHKSWTATKKGTWVQWKSYSTLDWNDKDSVERMNKWREQAATRNDWPKKRETPRQDYSQAEREWLFSFVKQAKGERPKNPIDDIVRQFNERFNQKRDSNGILGVIDRLRKEFKKYNGKMKSHQKRGHNKKKEAEEKKRRRDSSEEDTEEE